MKLLLLAACLACGNPAEVEIEQGGWLTRGTVVHASREHGTWILTTKHGHPVQAAWRASGGLVGRYTRVDGKADLALLWTSQFVPGQEVRSLAPVVPAHGRCRRQKGVLFTVGLKSQDGHSLVGMSGVLPVGSSGSGLLDADGRLCGVCSGATFGATCFVSRGSVERFLQGR